MSGQNTALTADQPRVPRGRPRKALAAKELFAFPNSDKCYRMIRRSQELRCAGYDQGEIDDVVAAENGITGAQLQVIWLHALDFYQGLVDGILAMNKNAVDFGCSARKNVFTEAPGRRW